MYDISNKGVEINNLLSNVTFSTVPLRDKLNQV